MVDEKAGLTSAASVQDSMTSITFPSLMIVFFLLLLLFQLGNNV